MTSIEKQFDIVIPVGPYDIDIIEKQIEYTKKNIIGYRNIYILSYTNIDIEGCIYIDEKIFPFDLDTIIKIYGYTHKNRWYLQQLLKLYCFRIIPDILDTYLVLDADTFFLKPTEFIEDGKCLYNYGDEYNMLYFIHMNELHPDFVKVVKASGITHHMMFEKRILEEIFKIIEDKYEKDFWIVYLHKVKKIYRMKSGCSEYELYFNYILRFHSDEIKIRKLKWCNDSEIDELLDYDYISCHYYLRKKELP